MTTPDVSVIVLNYNGRQWLKPCLDALAAQRGAPAFEVMVVDNASTDGSADYVREHFPGVRVHDAGGNLGFSGGNNAGAEQAHGRLLVFLNNDTSAAPDWLHKLTSALDARPDFGFATSRIVFADNPERIDSAGDGYLFAGGAFKRGYGQRADDFAEPREVFGACGCAMVMKRELFEALGGFDPSFFIFYEDVDLSYRAQLLGARCWYAADAVVRHAGSGTMGRQSVRAVFYGQRNLEWTWLKNTPGPLLARSFVSHAVYSVAGVAYYAKQGLFWPALKGKLTALAGAGRVLRDRRRIQRGRHPDLARLERLLTRSWWRLKQNEKRAAETPSP
ncbi:MAG: glycosyltransferase family 2 protein [Acidobacteriota bacterium]|nr:glycosyltransferase family 2 protein [Acidobacteriota bacterium]